ncbi:rhodanese-like domain-containing protein [Novipirellula sp.]|uniref:rhodanese-like domain-containing protein n=1 Tax=Novipirellula sp. TaxID=2795430 RepID=UPI003562FE04
MSQSSELPIQIDVQTVSEMLKQGDDFLLLDVREPNEYAVAKITGSTLLPLSEIGARVHELEEHKDRRIVVHCHHGGRSLQVTEALRSRGFNQVQNMDGGIDVWSQQIDPSVNRY